MGVKIKFRVDGYLNGVVCSGRYLGRKWCIGFGGGCISK